jgi:shikimate kinase
MHQRLFLLGLMGAGKTSIGKRLSRELDWPYIDNDVLLEERTDRTAREVADDEGFQGLHAHEANLVHALAQHPTPAICAIPGSSGDRPDELRHLRDHGVVVYLCLQPEALEAKALKRSKGDDAHRPWRPGEVGEQLQQMFAERDPVFRDNAHLVIDIDNGDKDGAAQRIVEYLQEQGVTEA